jgi:hypothetical protein
MNVINEFIDGFNQLVQLVFGFALGLAFSQSNITVGWIFFWITVWEFGVYLLFHKSKYYDPFFRVAYNCVFLLSILAGQYIYFGKTTFQNFLYPNSIETKKTFSGEKYKFMEKFEQFLENAINGEEEENKKKKLRKKYRFYLRND